MIKYSSFLYFNLYKYFHIYTERNQLLGISKLGSFKIKFNLYFLLYNNNSIFLLKLFILNYLLYSKKKETNKKILFQTFISLLVVSILTGFRAKFKIHGRGYKLHKR